MDAYSEAVDGDIVLKFKSSSYRRGEITLFSMVPINSSMRLMKLLVRGMAQTGAKLLSVLAWVEPPKFLISIKESGYLMVSWKA